jgi:hypothetical protein
MNRQHSVSRKLCSSVGARTMTCITPSST